VCVGESERVRVRIFSIGAFCTSVARAAIEVCERERERMSW